MHAANCKKLIVFKWKDDILMKKYNIFLLKINIFYNYMGFTSLLHTIKIKKMLNQN